MLSLSDKLIGPVEINPSLLDSALLAGKTTGKLNATLKAHGLYSSFQYVLRLSPAVHKKLAEVGGGIKTAREAGFDGALAFSTLLHETVHWWQHVGSTYGLMLSLTYPVQAHANYKALKELTGKVGFKKSIRQLVGQLSGPTGSGTIRGLANTIVNNHFDFGAFRDLTFNQTTARAAAENPFFECVGHSHEITYGNNLLVLAATLDPEFRAFQHPRDWEAPFHELREAKTLGFYHGSRVQLWPVGVHEIFEGQACFCQLQYLTFASGGRLGWDDYRMLGMLHGVYERAFQLFLTETGLPWPSTVDHPTVALFLLICDMAINPGAGFPFPITHHFASFVTDTDPGTRFTMLSALIRLKCPDAATMIRRYSREEYEAVSTMLAAQLLVESPLAIAECCSKWSAPGAPFESLMREKNTFDYAPTNLPVRVLFSHFLAFMQDKFSRPEYFCWPGAWMAGERAAEEAKRLFEKHQALFIDKEDDDGVFPRLHPDIEVAQVQKVFNAFYATTVTYDLTDQWISQPGPFRYCYDWLSQTTDTSVMKAFADGNFRQVYGMYPDDVECL
ncbi:hypothetical protein ACVOMS_05625 [Bradyrhizobium guangxiense]